MDRAEFNQMMGEAEAVAESSEWQAPEKPLWARFNTINWAAPSGVFIGFDLGNADGDQPYLTITPPGMPAYAVAGFRDWSLAVATLSHLFSMFPQADTDAWRDQRDWVHAVHAEALRREIAARDAREATPGE